MYVLLPLRFVLISHCQTGGGKDSYSVYLVDGSDEPSVTSGGSESSGSSTTGTSSQTQDQVVVTDGQTTVVTPAGESQAASTKEADKKSNTAAIAAGVVVGVVGFCALIGAAFFFYRFKKRRAQGTHLNTGVAEHYNKPMSTSSNSRFDGDFMAQRRQSNGSIDDDQDFSRRILQVGLTRGACSAELTCGTR